MRGGIHGGRGERIPRPPFRVFSRPFSRLALSAGGAPRYNGERKGVSAMRRNQTLRIVMIALFAALVCVATMLVPIPIPGSGGYANAGDGIILTCAFLMGPVGAAFASGIGAMLADLLLGYAAFAPGTLVLKAAVALTAGALSSRLRGQRRGAKALGALLVSGIAAEALMVLGYFLYEALLMGAGMGALGGVAANAGQGAAGIVIALALTALLDGSAEFRELMDRVR